MKNYRVFRHPAGIYEPVKMGWSWPAFFFGMVWMLVKKMWLAFLFLLCITFLGPTILFAQLDENLAFQLCNVFTILVSVALGVFGNGLRELYLRRAGYVLVGHAQGANPGMALAMFILNAQEGQGLAGQDRTAAAPTGAGAQTLDATAYEVRGDAQQIHECTDDSEHDANHNYKR